MAETDYTALADAALAYPDSQSAFVALAAQSTITQHGELMLTDKQIAARLGLTATVDLMLGLKAAIVADAFPEFALGWLTSTGIDLIDPSTAPMLDSLVPTYLSAELVASIKALANIVTPAWPGLTLGHVDSALGMRANKIALQAAIDAAAADVAAAQTVSDSAGAALDNATATLEASAAFIAHAEAAAASESARAALVAANQALAQADSDFAKGATA